MVMSRNVEFGIGEYYHVYDRGVEKRKIFLDRGDHERFVRLLYVANSVTSVHLSNYQSLTLRNIPKGKPLVSIGAWVLMPNHFHLLLKENIEGRISLFMQKLITGYTMYFNKKYQRRGSLFEGTFRVKHLDTDEYLKYQYTYIHLNPIGIIDKGWKEKIIHDKKKSREFLEKYKFSSFRDYSDKSEREESVILNKKAFPKYFEEYKEFNNMVQEWVDFEGINIKVKP